MKVANTQQSKLDHLDSAIARAKSLSHGGVPVKNIELAIRQDAAPVQVERTPEGVVRVWVSMNTTSGEIESACNSAGLAPHHVNLATALWSNNNFDRHFSNEGNEELGYVLVRLPEEQ